MDISKIEKSLLSKETISAIAKKTGGSDKDVKSIIETALPMLLGGEKDVKTASKAVAKKSGTDADLTKTVLILLLPMLLKKLGKKDDDDDKDESSLLGTLLQSSDIGDLAGSLLGGKDDKDDDDDSLLGSMGSLLGNLLK